MPSRNPNWRVQMSNSRGLPYFYSPAFGISSWDVPEGLSAEDVQKLPGAAFLKGMDEPKIYRHSGKEDAVEEARVSHILLRHTQSRNPNRKRDASQRTCSEALSIAKKYINEINGNPATFAQLAKKVSDCSSHARGGDMGWFMFGQVQNEFEKEAFKLEIGKISVVPVETASGVHILLKTGGVVKPAATEGHNGEMTTSPATIPATITEHAAGTDGGATPKGRGGAELTGTAAVVEAAGEERVGGMANGKTPSTGTLATRNGRTRKDSHSNVTATVKARMGSGSVVGTSKLAGSPRWNGSA